MFNSGLFPSTSSTTDPESGLLIGNRAVSADHWAKIIKKVMGNGISKTPSISGLVQASTGMAVTVQPVYGAMEGYTFDEDEIVTLNFTSSTEERIFYIGVRLVLDTYGWAYFYDDAIGSFATFVGTTDRSFAKLTIPANAVEINNNMIEDLRDNPTYCGVIDSYLESLSAILTAAQTILDAFESEIVPPHASSHAADGSDPITTDALPVEFSANPLQSGGAYAALADKLPNNVSPITLLINGGFDIWQGGTSFTATGYTADQWKLTLGSGMAITATRQAFTVGQTDVPTEPAYYVRLAISNAGTADGYFEQRIESVRVCAGGNIACSFYAKCDSGTYAAKIRMVQSFGSGGSADVASSDQDITLTTSWQRFTGAFSLASISGKTIGAGDYLSMRLILPTASGTKTISIATAQANPGTVALPYVKVSNLTELEYCKRYAILSGVANGLLARMVFYTPNYIVFHIPTTVTMRADPTFLGTANTDTIVLTTAAAVQSGFSFVATAVPSGVYITATKNSHGLTDAILIFSASGGLIARL